MEFLNYKKDLFTKKVWNDIKDINTRLISNHIDLCNKEEIITKEFETYHATIGGFNLDYINLSHKVNKPYRNGFIIKGKFNFIVFPHESNKDIPFDEDKNFTVYSKDDYYGEYKEYIEYCWGLWDRRKPGKVIYRHDFERALTPTETNKLHIIPDEYINREGERIKITDLRVVRNKQT